MLSFIWQDQIEKKKMKIYKRKELKPKRDGTNGTLRPMRGAYPRKIWGFKIRYTKKKNLSSCSKNKNEQKTNNIVIKNEKSTDYATAKPITTLLGSSSV